MGKKKSQKPSKMEIPFESGDMFQTLDITAQRADALGDEVASIIALAVVAKDVQAGRILTKSLNMCRSEGEKIFVSVLVGMGLAVTKTELEDALKEEEEEEEDEELEEVPKNY